jgi:hypothetical protein
MKVENWIFAGTLMLAACTKPPEGAEFASTGVGNGGDLVARFLEVSRFSLNETVSLILRNPESPSLCQCPKEKLRGIDQDGILCQTLLQLSDEQRKFCRRFLNETSPDYLRLNSGSPRVPFEVTTEPLWVSNAFGQRRPVDAVTRPGPEGSVQFHLPRLNEYSPSSLVALIGHELGHKVAFAGKLHFVDDNSPQGPFSDPEGGRQFLDTVGAALAIYGALNGKIQSRFGIDDYFSCEIKIGGQGVVDSYGRSARKFVRPGFDRYETGMGLHPRDMACAQSEDLGRSWVTFVITIHEETGCAHESQGRWSKWELWRYFTPKNGEPTPPPQWLSGKARTGWNPTCEKTTHEPMTLSYQTGDQVIQFTSVYQGFKGTTRPAFDVDD